MKHRSNSNSNEPDADRKMAINIKLKFMFGHKINISFRGGNSYYNTYNITSPEPRREGGGGTSNIGEYKMKHAFTIRV